MSLNMTLGMEALSSSFTEIGLRSHLLIPSLSALFVLYFTYLIYGYMSVPSNLKHPIPPGNLGWSPLGEVRFRKKKIFKFFPPLRVLQN